MTAQVPDELVYEGKQHCLFSNPLEDYFQKNPPRPNFIPESTAERRGYSAIWEIRGGALYLSSLSGTLCVKPAERGGRVSSWCRGGHHGQCEIRMATLVDIFDCPTGEVLADWFSGDLRVPHGTMVEYVHAGYASRYERYLMIKIEKGLVTGTRIVGDDEYLREEEARWAEIEKTKKRWWRFWI